MTPKRLTLALAATFALSSSLSADTWRRDNVLDTREESLPAKGVTTIKIDAEAGALRIVGKPGARDVALKAEFRGRDESVLSHLLLKHRRSGDTLFITAKTGADGLIDLALAMPADVDLKINDGSGSMGIRNVDGTVFINDGSGSIELSGIGGEVSIHDGSGSVSARDLGDGIRVLDGSGPIDIANVGGTVQVQDGSGSMSIRNVSGDVIVTDGSGSIDVSNVGGEFELLANGSGSVSRSNIGGMSLGS